MLLCLVVWLALLVGQADAILNSDSRTIKHARVRATLREGQVEGRIEESSGVFGEVYHSIPYAAEPDGELRFELPKPIASWKGVADASRLAHCFQFSAAGASHTTMDCLHVKVVVPLDAQRRRYAEPLPVLVWIHGGSYQYLGKSLYNTSGILSAISSRKIVFVSVAYRLGMFGFLSLGERDLPGNLALHDLVAALRFVHANARPFNADAARISVAGESAGAAAASILAVSPLTRGLIASSLSFSGSIYAPWAVRTEQTRAHSRALIRAAGCERETAAETKKCLQSMPLAELRRHENEFMTETEKELYELYRMGCAAFTPVGDAFMQRLSVIPHDLSRPGALVNAARVPALLSTTADERLVATKELVNSEFGKVGRSVPGFLPLIMAAQQPGKEEVIDAMRAHYFDGATTMSNEAFELALTVSQNGEQFAAAHAEALDYAAANQSAFVLKADVHDGRFPSWHGVDVWILFDCFDMANRSGFANWTYNSWREFDAFRVRLADTIEEFVNTGSLRERNARFTSLSRVATKISNDRASIVDADTNDYYFWRKTLPLIESLNSSISSKMFEAPRACFDPYRFPFYASTTLLIVSMLVSGVLFSQRKRRLTRERRALKHLNLAS